MKRKHQVDISTQVPNTSIQEAFKEIQNLVRHQIRGATLAFVQGLFEQEMEELCGKPFSRKNEHDCHRGGSDPGSVILEGRRVTGWTYRQLAAHFGVAKTTILNRFQKIGKRESRLNDVGFLARNL